MTTTVTVKAHNVAAGSVPSDSDYTSQGTVLGEVFRRGSREVDFANRQDSLVDTVIHSAVDTVSSTVTAEMQLEWVDDVGTHTINLRSSHLDEQKGIMVFRGVESGS